VNVNSYAPVTRKFISAVWRRILLIRIVESIALSTAVAAAAGLALMPILWWRGQSGLPLALAMLILGTTSGLIWGIARRPTRFAAALEADRQLNLHDLLGTVYLLADVAADPWGESLAVISDTRCRSLRPSAVVVNRLGLRAWGGVGVLGALLITLGLFTSRPIEVSAATSSSATNPHALRMIQPPVAIADQASSRAARPPGSGGTDDISNRGFEQDRPDDSPANALSKTNSAQNHAASADDSAIGGGAAVTHSQQSPQESPPILATADNPSHSGPAAVGAGQSDASAHSPGDFGGTSASHSRNLNPSSPPWQTSEWPADAAAARAAIGSGRVPDSDADLVRDYFQRD
jgi:hypothetical protein